MSGFKTPRTPGSAGEVIEELPGGDHVQRRGAMFGAENTDLTVESLIDGGDREDAVEQRAWWQQHEQRDVARGAGVLGVGPRTRCG